MALETLESPDQNTAAEVPGKTVHPENKATQIRVQEGRYDLPLQKIKSSSTSEKPKGRPIDFEYKSAKPGNYLLKDLAEYNDDNTWDEHENIPRQKLDVIQSKANDETVGRITDDAVNEMDKNQQVVGHIDLASEKTKEKHLVAQERDIILPSVSLKPTKTISLFDFAGEHAYYACHHIFLSPRCFYILVTDMSKELNKIPLTGQSQEFNNMPPKVAKTKQKLAHSDWTYQGMSVISKIVYSLISVLSQ
jgi:hypothetical protein